MANVRLRVNMILGGKFHVRGSLVDLELIPEHLRTPTHIDRDLEAKHGLVLLLKDLNFNAPVVTTDNIPTTFPTRVSRGELFDLGQVPESHRERLQDGLDYKSSWTHQELEEIRREQEDIYTRQLEAEPESVPTGAPWRNR